MKRGRTPFATQQLATLAARYAPLTVRATPSPQRRIVAVLARSITVTARRRGRRHLSK
jgi:hypothetical protein